jgi:hypothetical protein
MRPPTVGAVAAITYPGSSGAPFSTEMLCTVLRTQAMFFLLSGFADDSPYRPQSFSSARSPASVIFNLLTSSGC